ncbi:unnamed protein product, partial [Porites evermanni]
LSPEKSAENRIQPKQKRVLSFFRGKREMTLNTEYVKSMQGILKILEFVTMCMAFSCLADFNRELAFLSDKFLVRYDFFMAVFVIGWVVVLLVFLVFLFSLTEKDLTLAVS